MNDDRCYAHLLPLNSIENPGRGLRQPGSVVSCYKMPRYVLQIPSQQVTYLLVRRYEKPRFQIQFTGLLPPTPTSTEEG